MPIRVCQLITELRLSGAERVVYELARRLDRSRFEVCVTALRGGQVEQMLLAAGIPVHVLGVRGRWDIGKLHALSRLLRRERIDLLHTHLFHADLVGRPAAMLADVPHVVHTIHVAEQRFRPWQYAYARLMDFRCDRLVCVSQSVRDHHALRSRLPISRYTVIPNGVDVAPVDAQASQTARARTRQQWGLTPRQTAVLFAGRLDRQKGIDVLLEAMTRCGTGILPVRGMGVPPVRGMGVPPMPHEGETPSPQPSQPDLRFVIAGDGPRRALVERYLAQGTGLNCRFLGFVSNIQDAMLAADLFVLPSRWEGWPLALAEAMAAGLPCIGADVPGIRDIIEHGRTGLLVPMEDSATLAETIIRLADDGALREKLSTAGRELIRRKFSIETNVAAHEELYEQVCL